MLKEAGGVVGDMIGEVCAVDKGDSPGTLLRLPLRDSSESTLPLRAKLAGTYPSRRSGRLSVAAITSENNSENPGRLHCLDAVVEKAHSPVKSVSIELRQ